MYELVGPVDWARSSLFDLATWKNGLAFKNIQFSDSGDPVIKIAELKSGITKQTKFTRGEYGDEVRVEPGDMLFSWSGNPDTSIDVFEWDGPPGWLNQHIYKLTSAGSVSRDFLFFLLKWLKPRFAEIARNKQTTGLGHVTLADFKQMQVGLPKSDEQAAIVAWLKPYHDKIELNRRMNETLEEMARALFRDWFVDFGPTRRQIEGAIDPAAIMGHAFPPEKAATLAPLFPAKLGDDGLPEGWDEQPFEAFVEIVGGGTPKTKIAEYWGGDIPWFSVVDAPTQGAVYVHSTEKSITKAGLENSSARMVPEGTTIISARGTVGKIGMAPGDMTFNQSCYALRPKNPVGERFVFLATGQLVERLQAMAHGSVFSTITRNTFSSLSFAGADELCYSAFEDVTAPLFAKIKANGQENQTLAALRDLLLPKLMSGEIRLSDAEACL